MLQRQDSAALGCGNGNLPVNSQRSYRGCHRLCVASIGGPFCFGKLGQAHQRLGEYEEGRLKAPFDTDSPRSSQTTSGEIVNSITGARVTDLAVTAAGDKLVVVCHEKKIRSYDLETVQELKWVFVGSRGRLVVGRLIVCVFQIGSRSRINHFSLCLERRQQCAGQPCFSRDSSVGSGKRFLATTIYWTQARSFCYSIVLCGRQSQLCGQRK